MALDAAEWAPSTTAFATGRYLRGVSALFLTAEADAVTRNRPEGPKAAIVLTDQVANEAPCAVRALAKNCRYFQTDAQHFREGTMRSLVCAATAALTFALAISISSSTAQTTLRLGVQPELPSLPVIIAAERGFLVARAKE